jgi:hypothetical protein
MSQPAVTTSPNSTGPALADPSPGPDPAAVLQDELRLLREELDQARVALAEARQHAEEHDRDLDNFKTRVAAVAMNYAREHNWCSVVTEALDELGLEPPPTRISGTLTVTYSFAAELDPKSRGQLSAEWLRQSVVVSGTDAPTLDSDFDNTHFDVDYVAIDDYRVLED